MKRQVASVSPQILPCKCVVLTSISAKSAASKVKAVCTNIPFNTREAGAQFQDSKYGPGKRLHNPRIKDGKHLGFACSVCGEKKAA